MHKKLYILFAIVVVFAVLTTFFFTQRKNNNTSVACPQLAQMCPDGSYVGPSGPHCDFAPCPTAAMTSSVAPTQNHLGYLTGKVLLSPTCPVERIPPDPQCAPKPYATLVTISTTHNFYMVLHSATDGSFFTPLPAGQYTIMTHESGLYPSCRSQQVTVTDKATTTIVIDCDTGIR